MAQHLEQAPKPLSQWSSQPSQNPDDIFPPAKRQRLSPLPGSPLPQSPHSALPNSPPNSANISLPNSFSQSRSLINGSHDNSAASPSGAGVMGPPQRPAERERGPNERETRIDINDLSDLVTSSGIDLKEEENYLANSYRTDRQQNNISFTSQQTLSPQNSFDLLSQNNFGSIGGPTYGTGSFGQIRSVDEEEQAKRKAAARAASERAQFELNEPFLLGNVVRKTIEDGCTAATVKMPVEGLYDRINSAPQVQSTTGNGNDAQQAPSLLSRGAPLDAIISLLSLATNERLRSLMEDTFTLARGRQLASDGIVPPDWSSLAADAEKAKPVEVTEQSATKSSWDQPRDAGSHSLPSPPISDAEPQKPAATDPPKKATIAFAADHSIAAALHSMIRNDRSAEEARLKARAARRAKKAAATGAAATASTPDSSGQDAGSTDASATKSNLPPGMLGEKAPEVKMTKKERDRLAKQDLSDEVATRNANTTATMQLGGRSYSWMTKGVGSKPGTPTRGGSGSGTLTAGGTSSSAAAAAAAAAKNDPAYILKQTKDRKFGLFHENEVTGRNVQLRDWIATLEVDGRSRGTLNTAYLQLDAEKQPQK